MTTPLSVLVVDDSAMHHQMYDLVFAQGEFAGTAVHHATSGREGYTLLQAHPELTVVFLDLTMSEMNAFEFLERRRAEGLHPHVPVVLVTAGSTGADERRGRDAGAWECLRKPFAPTDLERVVDRARTLGAPACFLRTGQMIPDLPDDEDGTNQDGPDHPDVPRLPFTFA